MSSMMRSARRSTVLALTPLVHGLALSSGAHGRHASLDCEHFDSCSGCKLSGLEWVRPPLLDQAEDYFEARDVLLASKSMNSPAVGWRTSARLAVRSQRDQQLSIGLFREKSHIVEEIPRCAVHHPAINQVVNDIRRELIAFGDLSAYDEVNHCGVLRYLQVSVERSTSLVQVVLVVNAPALDAEPSIADFAAHLWTASTADLHSIWVNLNPTTTNNILSYADGAWQLLKQRPAEGSSTTIPGSLVEHMASGAAFVLPPYVFRQANLDAFDSIIAELCAAVPDGSRIVEWYAGVGVIGLALAGRSEWVRCSDVNPPHEAFEASRALLPPASRERISYTIGRASDRLEDARGANVAIVDPPRKGLDAGLLRALCEPRTTTDKSCAAAGDSGACSSIGTLIYVSCGFHALERDADELVRAGWAVRNSTASAYVLFPGANHIETVVIFDRKEAERSSGTVLAAASTPRRANERPSRDPSTPRGRRLAAAKKRSREGRSR